MTDELAAWLDRFQASRSQGPFPYPWASTHIGGEHDQHVVFGSMVHGDERGSLPGVVRVMEHLADGSLRFGGTVTFFVGNPEAGLQDARFLDSDLNRVFVDQPPDDHEGRRAQALRPILDAADLFIDLHQTIRATQEPFYIFPFQVPGWYWARAVGGARVWVTRHPEQSFSAGSCCADEYVRLRGRPGITLELSEKGFGNGAEALAEQAIVRTLALADAVAEGTSLREAAMEMPEIAFYETAHREPFTDDTLALREGLVNFQRVRAGEVLSAPGTPLISAPCDGALLFPKYPPRVDGRYKRPLPGEIVRVIRPLDGHPLDLYGLEED